MQRLIPSHKRALIIILLLGITISLHAQCFDMTTLDASGTHCACANHEYERVDVTTYWYAWKWYDNRREDYGLTGWNYTYGMNNLLLTRQTVVKTAGQDYLQSQLSMLPPGESTSFRLGNPRAGNTEEYDPDPYQYAYWHQQAEAIYFDYTVPKDNPLILFQYAAVLDHSSHYLTGDNKNAAARIEVFITDMSGNKLNANTLAFTRSGDNSLSSNTEWKSFYRSGGYQCYWKDWTTVGFDLSQYIGQTIRFRVENYECILKSPSTRNFQYCGKHFGYLYFFMDCAGKQIEEECLEHQMVRLSAPEGFTYRWYKKGTSTTLGTGSSIEVLADGKITYCCQLTQKEGMTGSFVLEATPLCNPVAYLYDTICQGDSYEFNGQHLTKPGIYEHTTHLPGGTDSITYLDLTVQDAKDMPIEKATFCEGSTYTWGNHGSRFKDLTQPGDYYDTLRYRSGCDSMRYHLQLNIIDKIYTTDHLSLCMNAFSKGVTWNGIPLFPTSSGESVTLKSIAGCDSVVTLDLKIQDKTITYDTVVHESIDDYPFEWKGWIVWPEDDNVYETYTNRYGCDSTVYLHHFIAKSDTSFIDTCDNELPFEWRGCIIHGMQDNGKRVVEKGKSGKDSIFYTLRLTIHPTYTLTHYASICIGDTLPLGDTLLTTSGTYTRLLQTVYGCDSMVTLHLNVQEPTTRPVEKVGVCEGTEFKWEGHGKRYEKLTESGTYRDTLYYTTGCDSVYFTLQLTVNKATSAEIYDVLCEGDTLKFGKQIIRKEGTYYNTIRNLAGCDSVITLHISMGKVAHDTVQGSFCKGGSYVFHGKTYDKAGTYSDTLISAHGCDSIVTLQLTEGKEFVYQLDTAICQGDSIVFADSVFATPGKWTRRFSHEGTCDSVMTLILDVHPTHQTNDTLHISSEELPTTWNKIEIKSQSDDGKVARLDNQYGCDSVVTLRLYVHAVKDSLEHDTICSNHGETYRWRGQTISIGDERRYALQDTIKDKMLFDSIRITLQLYVIRVEQKFDFVDICQSSPNYYWGDSLVWDTTKVWIDTLFTYQDKSTTDYFTLSYQGTKGCESTVRIAVDYHKSHEQYATDTICMNQLDEYQWRGHRFSQGHLTASDTLKTTDYGCDSILHFQLVVHDTFNIHTGAHVCEAALPYRWKNGDNVIETFTKDDWLAGDTIRSHRFSTIYGCDSMVTFTLTVSEVYEVQDGDHTCTLPYEWKNGTETIYVFTEQDITQGTLTQQHTFVSQTGCDSVVTFTLIPQLSTTLPTDSVVVTDGKPYTWEGHGERFKNLTENGLYRDTSWYHSGCDSVYYSLWLQFYTPKVEGYLVVDTLCGNDPSLNIEFVCTAGAPKKYDILFGESAHKYFRDSTNCSYPTSTVLNHAVPTQWPTDEMFVRPDEYSLQLVIYDALENKYTYKSTFMVLYPSSILTQRWNDVLMLNNATFNGGYEFSHIQWYHGGEVVDAPSSTGSYIYTNLAMGESYWAVLTRTDDGKTIRTCDFVPTPQDDNTRFAAKIQVAARRGGNMRQLQVTANISGQYKVYDATGKIVGSGNFSSTPNDIDLPAAGCYILQFIGDEGTNETRKWIAK